MEINDFVGKFAEQFDETDSSLFTPETEFRDTDDWSSMMGLTIMAMIDDEYDVQIKADEFRKAETIQELFDLVNSKLQS